MTTPNVGDRWKKQFRDKHGWKFTTFQAETAAIKFIEKLLAAQMEEVFAVFTKYEQAYHFDKDYLIFSAKLREALLQSRRGENK